MQSGASIQPGSDPTAAGGVDPTSGQAPVGGHHHHHGGGGSASSTDSSNSDQLFSSADPTANDPLLKPARSDTELQHHGKREHGECDLHASGLEATLTQDQNLINL